MAALPFASLTTMTTIRRPSLHASQRDVLRSAKRYTVVACGRRWGKTHLATRLVMRTAVRGRPVGYFAPAYKFLLEFWRDISRRLAPIAARVNASERRIELLTGGVVECWTLENEHAARSRKYARVVIDEAGIVPHLDVLWNAAIRPTLADLRGDAWLFGTPYGRNFFWQCYLRGQTDADWMSVTKTTYDNPHIPPAEIDALRATMSERAFRQEILAEFLEDGGGVFRNVRSCLGEPVASGQPAIIGVDWGRVNDATVFVAVDPQTRAVIATRRLLDTSFDRQRAALVALWEQTGRGPIIAESNGMGLPNVEALQRAGLPVQPMTMTAAVKAQLIDSLALAFEQRTITLPPDDHWLVHELEAYEMERSPNGLPRYSAPAGAHDDGVIALALAWSGMAAGALVLWEV